MNGRATITVTVDRQTLGALIAGSPLPVPLAVVPAPAEPVAAPRRSLVSGRRDRTAEPAHHADEVAVEELARGTGETLPPATASFSSPSDAEWKSPSEKAESSSTQRMGPPRKLAGFDDEYIRKRIQAAPSQAAAADALGVSLATAVKKMKRLGVQPTKKSAWKKIPIPISAKQQRKGKLSKLYSDDQLREILSSAASIDGVALQLDVTPAAVYYQMNRLGIVRNNATVKPVAASEPRARVEFKRSSIDDHTDAELREMLANRDFAALSAELGVGVQRLAREATRLGVKWGARREVSGNSAATFH